MCVMLTRIICALLTLSYVNCARILGVFPAPSISHQIIFQPIWKQLSLNGHQVTVITPNPLKDPNLVNLTEIDVSFAYDILAKSNFVQNLQTEGILWKLLTLLEVGLEIIEAELNSTKVQNVINDSEVDFDLVVFQIIQNFNLVTAGFGEKFKCPTVEIISDNEEFSLTPPEIRERVTNEINDIPPSPKTYQRVIFQPIWRELSLRGHDVTVITPNPLNDQSLTNLTEIDVFYTYDVIRNSEYTKHMYKERFVHKRIDFLTDFGIIVNEVFFEDRNIRDLLSLRRDTFDVIILQQSHILTLSLGFAAKFQAPVIAISSLGVFLHSHDAIGNPTHPVISPDMMLNFSGELSFFDRVTSLLFNFWYRFLYYWYALPKADRVARKYFGEDMPYLGDIEKNISMMLLNVNPIIHTVRPNVPNVIEINQMHIREKKPLPQELKNFLDSSPQGVVYFSLGSNVKSANLSSNIRQEIIGALAELPYKVLWKWETDYLPDQPDNVMTRKWLPQQDILGHPNVKVFVTQGGLQSIEEAITNEVPMVGMPFITDQPSNIKKIIELGMGLGVDYKNLAKEELKKAIVEVAENKKYKQNVQKSRSILVDQPMKGVGKAIWWIEYVIRHKGAKHLRSPAADMSFSEYFMLDVILFLVACFVLAFYCSLNIVRLGKKLTFTVKKVKKN